MREHHGLSGPHLRLALGPSLSICILPLSPTLSYEVEEGDPYDANHDRYNSGNSI